MTEQNQELSLTRETVAMHLGPGRYWTLTESDLVSALHIGPAGVTFIEYEAANPFDSLRCTTIAWQAVKTVAFDASSGEHIHVGMTTDDEKMMWRLERDDADSARSIYALLRLGLGGQVARLFGDE